MPFDPLYSTLLYLRRLFLPLRPEKGNIDLSARRVKATLSISRYLTGVSHLVNQSGYLADALPSSTRNTPLASLYCSETNCSSVRSHGILGYMVVLSRITIEEYKDAKYIDIFGYEDGDLRAWEVSPIAIPTLP